MVVLKRVRPFVTLEHRVQDLALLYPNVVGANTTSSCCDTCMIAYVMKNKIHWICIKRTTAISEYTYSVILG